MTYSLLRIATAGSVDDGKSTLVGRLLYDTKSVLADQYDAVARASRDRGLEQADLALLTDGLRSEREQGITIDVAYRYFASATRSYILADCPGHVQYTRNTVTGASTADVLVLLVDVRKGLQEQTKRHLAVGALLRVPHVVVVVNKMDLVEFDQARFTEVTDDVLAAARSLGMGDIAVIPVSALIGDNVVTASEQMPWYDGPALLEYLENLTPVGADDLEPLRLPVQIVIRPQSSADERFRDYRGYAGQIASGSVKVGDEVTILPNGRTTTVVGIDTADQELEEAHAPLSVTLRLADDIDISHGDLIVSSRSVPTLTQEIEGTLAWLADTPLHPRSRVLVKHGTKTVQAMVSSIDGSLDLDEISVTPATHLELNDIGQATLRLAGPLPVEDYVDSRATGSFLVIDPDDGRTLAAGMVGEDRFARSGR